MGMYDTILFRCPQCGEQMEAQSKSGPCALGEYQAYYVPGRVAAGANRHAPFKCKCGKAWKFSIPKVALLLVKADAETEDDEED